MTESIFGFAKLFNAKVNLDRESILKVDTRFFDVSSVLEKSLVRGFSYAGLYLGEQKALEFHPSFNLLRIIARSAENKVWVNDRTAWLFVCGRDVFGQGIFRTEGSYQEQSHVLIMNQYGECLGYGRLVKTLHLPAKGLAVKNLLDIGDFLRRER